MINDNHKKELNNEVQYACYSRLNNDPQRYPDPQLEPVNVTLQGNKNYTDVLKALEMEIILDYGGP